MRRWILAVLLAVCSLSLAAQEEIKVNYQGERPTIRDLGWAYLDSFDGEENIINEALDALKQAWLSQRYGGALEEGESLTIDEKNGFILYEIRGEENLFRIEMCFWNEADQKHKLFACNVGSYSNGKYDAGQYDGIEFFRYDNGSKQMVRWHDVGLGEDLYFEDGAEVSYELPRTGKDIVATIWYEKGPRRKTLRWDGRRFGE